MFYVIDGPASYDAGRLAREIERRAGLADLPPQITQLEVPGAGLGGGDGYVVGSWEIVEKLRAVDRNVIAYAVGDAFLITSVQEMGETMLRGDGLVRVPHGIFRVPAWGHRTYFAGETAQFVGEIAPLREAGVFVEPRRWRRRNSP